MKQKVDEVGHSPTDTKGHQLVHYIKWYQSLTKKKRINHNSVSQAELKNYVVNLQMEYVRLVYKRMGAFITLLYKIVLSSVSVNKTT